MQEASELLGRLVACPSVNAAGRARAGEKLEASLVELLRELLAGWGADVRVQEVAPGRPNLVAHFAPRAEPGRRCPSIMLEAHSDTVGVDDMTIPPFEPTVRGGRLYGRGASDTKGPMAAMLMGIKSVLDERGAPPSSVWFVSTCDEEMGASGARALVEPDGTGGLLSPDVAAEQRRGSQTFPDIAVVGEPTGLAVVHAHKGAVRWRITTHGVAAHSSDPSAGVNAISQMRKVLEVIEGPVAEAVSARRHPALGRGTITVGIIRGGSQVNVVPARCEIEVDRRLLPGETREAAAGEVTRALESLAASSGQRRRPGQAESDAQFRYSMRETQWYPPFEEAPDGPAVRAVAGACRKVLGEARLATAPYATNAGVFGGAGIPCVVFGPGEAAQAHTADEFIELEQVVEASRVYAEIIRGLGG